MNFDTAAQIKERLTIREVCERYGLHFDSRGRTLCPFHDDHHPSANIKENNQSFHCSPCGIHGDIFVFTEKMFNIDFKQAILRLNDDFHLGLIGQKPSTQAIKRFKREQAEREATRTAQVAYQDEYDRKVELHRYIWNALNRGKPRTWRDIKRRAGWMAQLQYLEWWLDNEDDKTITARFRKEHPEIYQLSLSMKAR